MADQVQIYQTPPAPDFLLTSLVPLDTGDTHVTQHATGQQIIDLVNSIVNLQQAYNNSTAPQTIRFASGQGLIFADHTGANRFVFTETDSTFLNPLSISETGVEGISFLQTSDPNSTLSETYADPSNPKGAVQYPVMTSTNEASIPTGGAPQGLGLFNSTINTLDFWSGSAWFSLINSISNQTIGGNKTFSNIIVGNIAGIATNANNLSTSQGSTNTNYFLAFFASSVNGYQSGNMNPTLTVNPFTNTIGANITGNAATATLASNYTLVTISTSTQTLAVQTRYVNTYSGGQLVASLPAAMGSGKSIELIGTPSASTSGFVINATNSAKIYLGSVLGATNGSVTSTAGSATDSVTLVDVATNLWAVYPALGLNLTVA